MSSCGCTCSANSSSDRKNLPLLCLVPREDGSLPGKPGAQPQRSKSASGSSQSQNFKLLDDAYLKEHFNHLLPKRALYLDTYRRPLITFPMTQEISNNFNMYRKTKLNQQVLDGFLDPREGVSAPSVFPYAKTNAEKDKEAEEDDEMIYILQLPDMEYECPVHKETIKTPRFIWHSCKKDKKGKGGVPEPGGGPLHKPKPWLLSRHTDFDLMSQW